MTAFALMALAILIRIRSFAVPYWAQVRETSATFFGFLGEQLSGTEDIRSKRRDRLCDAALLYDPAWLAAIAAQG